MVSAISSIDTLAYVQPVSVLGTNNYIAELRNSLNSLSAFQVYETVQQLQNEELLTGVNQTSSNPILPYPLSNQGLLEEDLLNLSPQALSVLNGIGNAVITNPEINTLTDANEIDTTQTATTTTQAANANAETSLLNGISSATTADAASIAAAQASDAVAQSANTTITVAQQQQLDVILDEYGNSPFNQATFDQIQGALVAAGINPQQISLQGMLQEMATPIPVYSTALEDELTNDTLVTDLLAA